MTVSEEDVERAIYLDFEGEGINATGAAPPPVLAGVLIEGEYQLIVFDRLLQSAAVAKGGKMMRRKEFMKNLVARAEDEARRIVHFSSHEEDIFGDYRVNTRGMLLDSKPLAKDLCRSTFKDCREARRTFWSAEASATARARARTKSFGLVVHCAKSLGLSIPGGYGFGKVGDRIRRCLGQGARGEYQDWPWGAKRSWTNLINHNSHDCVAMQFILQKI